MNPDKVVTQIKNLGEFIKNNQNSDGSIPSTDEGEHDLSLIHISEPTRHA